MGLMRLARLSGIAGAMLLGLGCWATALATEAEPRLSVAYEAPRLSVEAQGVSLTEVLREIGAKVGFGVIDGGVLRSPLTLSLKEVTLDAILRQLLAAENYAIVYRSDESAAGARIEAIVLLDTSRGSGARVEPSPRTLETAPVGQGPSWSGTQEQATTQDQVTTQ